MGFEKFKGGTTIGAGFKPWGDFPLIESCDIMVDNEGKRLDTKLQELESSPKPKEIKTEAEMNSILANATEADVGNYYKYTGNTTATYEQGAIYVIISNVLDGDGVSH